MSGITTMKLPLEMKDALEVHVEDERSFGVGRWNTWADLARNIIKEWLESNPLPELKQGKEADAALAEAK